jgi:nucleotide-binding universal stress UspA family protein
MDVRLVPPPPVSMRVPGMIPAAMFDSEDRAGEARAELERICTSVADDVRVSIFVHTPIGRPGEVLAEIARQLEASLIVVEAHDHEHDSKLRRAFHRSVAARLSREAPCSVLTVRPRREERAIQSRPAEAMHGGAQ